MSTKMTKSDSNRISAISKYQSYQKDKQKRSTKYKGKVDLNHRSLVITDYEKGVYETIHTVTYTYEDFKKSGIELVPVHSGDKALLFTPIYSDGITLEMKNGNTDALFDEIVKWLKKGKSVQTFELYMGSYSTVEECDADAIAVHEEQAKLYDAEAKVMCTLLKYAKKDGKLKSSGRYYYTNSDIEKLIRYYQEYFLAKDAKLLDSKGKSVNISGSSSGSKNSTSTNRKTQTHYTNGEVLSLVYDVWIGGKKLSMNKKACISAIDIKETVEGSDVATIVLNDPYFEFINDSLIVEDKTIKITLGWSSVTYRVTFEGYISALDIVFSNSGIPQLTINCMDKTHKMNRKKRTKTYKKCTSASVVKQICKKYGYTCVIEKGYKFKKQDTISQSNQSDIDFIQKLAKSEVYPFTARLVGKKFYYVKKGHLKDPKMTLYYNEYPYDVISFSPKINKETKQDSISSSSVSTKNKKTDSSEGSNKNKNNNITKDQSSGQYVYNPKTKKWTHK